MHEGRKQTNTWSAYAGSRLELSDALGRRRPKRHPSSRTGENPPYGMIGGIEETSASFEARSAPRSYPTAGGAQQRASLPQSIDESSQIDRPEFAAPEEVFSLLLNAGGQWQTRRTEAL